MIHASLTYRTFSLKSTHAKNSVIEQLQEVYLRRSPTFQHHLSTIDWSFIAYYLFFHVHIPFLSQWHISLKFRSI